jgi:hypothetical protein
MVFYNALFRPMPQTQPQDFTGRLAQTLRPAIGSADPGMVVPPFADPGYGMPNPPVENLGQGPATGWVPTAGGISPQMNSLLQLLYMSGRGRT